MFDGPFQTTMREAFDCRGCRGRRPTFDVDQPVLWRRTT